MERRVPDNRIRRVMDQALPGLEQDAWFEERVMQRIRQEETSTKARRHGKASVGLVVALVLIVLSATAVAAVSFNALSERVIKQEVENGNIEDWNAADKVALVDWMMEAGITLDADQVAQLHKEGLTDEERGEIAFEMISAYYPSRDGILTAVDLIAKEKGPIEYWSLEDKAWISEIMNKYDPVAASLGGNLLPGEHDISQEDALEVFYHYYLTEHGVERSEFLENTATFFFGENQFDDGSGPVMKRCWVINMDMTNGNDVGAYIGADGEIISAVKPNNMEPEWVSESQKDARDDEFITIEGIYAYAQKWRPVMEALKAKGVDLTGRDLYYFLEGKTYGLPGEDDIPRENAAHIARTAIMESMGWEADWFKYCELREAYRTEDSSGPMYWIIFRRYLAGDLADEAYDLGIAKLMPKITTVKIHAQNGAVVEILTSWEIDDMLFGRYGL